MDCIGALLSDHPLIWWGMLCWVLGLMVLLAVGVGYVMGADRWIGRQTKPKG